MQPLGLGRELPVRRLPPAGRVSRRSCARSRARRPGDRSDRNGRRRPAPASDRRRVRCLGVARRHRPRDPRRRLRREHGLGCAPLVAAAPLRTRRRRRHPARCLGRSAAPGCRVDRARRVRGARANGRRRPLTGAARAARRSHSHARRCPRARALARRGGADRSGRRTDPRRPQPLLPGRGAAAGGPGRRRGARRLLRLGRHGLRRAARASSSQDVPTRGCTPARGASGTQSARWRQARRRSQRAGARDAARSRTAARGRARALRLRARRAAAAVRRAAGCEPAVPR